MQIETQVKNAIGSGVLKAQDTLPSVRKLAADLGINPNTVAHAYRNLERDGVIATIPGGGTFIADGFPRFLKSERLRRLHPYAQQIAIEGSQLDLTDEEILRIVEENLENLGARK